MVPGSVVVVVVKVVPIDVSEDDGTLVEKEVSGSSFIKSKTPGIPSRDSVGELRGQHRVFVDICYKFTDLYRHRVSLINVFIRRPT